MIAAVVVVKAELGLACNLEWRIVYMKNDVHTYAAISFYHD